MVRSGFRLPWIGSKAPLSRTPLFFPPPQDPLALLALELEVQGLLAKGAVEVVQNPSSPGFYGRLFVVPKSSGGWRPVLDLSVLNLYLRQCRFKMETASSVRDAIRPADWAVSVDLKDAYFHVLIHKSDRKYLRFAWQGQVYQFIAVPFGLAPAPWLFTKITRELCRVVRGWGIRLRVYLDDWLLLATSEVLCRQQMRLMLEKCQELGFILNVEKSDLTPCQEFIYLGMKFNTLTWTVSPSPQRIARLQETLFHIISLKVAPMKLLASLLGSMESMALLIPLGRLHKRGVQRLFMESADFQNWSQVIHLDHRFHSAVAQWRDLAWLSQGVPITLSPPQEFLYTDASQRGWGAHMGSLTASGLWSPEMSLLHINHLELEAVFMALKQFEQALIDRHVLLNTDNTTVACYLNKQGGGLTPFLSLKEQNGCSCGVKREVSPSQQDTYRGN